MSAHRRYQPLRVLPARAYVPGREPHPSRASVTDGANCLPDVQWAEQAEYLWGIDLYNAGYFWEAHEAWEALFRAAEPDSVQQAFLQGLIQCAAACLKAAMGQPDAARRLGARASTHFDRVRAERGDAFMGLNLVAFSAALQRFLDTDAIVQQRPPPLVLVV